MKATVIDLAEHVAEHHAGTRARAIMLACCNPFLFYFMHGCMLPDYLARLDSQARSHDRQRHMTEA